MSVALATPQGKIGPQVGRAHQTLRSTILVSLLVGVSYYLTAGIGFAFALQPGSVSTLWLPNSILLAGLLLIPRQFWWVAILLAFPAHFASELQSGVPTSMVLSWFVSNSAQALIGATTITYFLNGSPRFDKSRHLVIFLLCGAFLAPFLSSFLDVALLKLNGWGTSSAATWRIRFFSNVLATLSCVPFILGWATGGLTALRKASLWRYLEAGILTASLILVGIIVFKSQHIVAESSQSILYWPLPFLLWATIRFGPRGASSSLLVVMFLAIAGATKGEGPFVANSAETNALSIQWFLIVVSIPLLGLATVIEERRRAEELARANEERLSLALNAAEMGTWDWDIANKRITLSDTARQMFDLSEDEAAPELETFYSLVHPDDLSSVKVALTNALETRVPYEAEFRVVSKGGVTRWLLGKGEVLYDRAGQPSRMLGVTIDITKRKKAEEASLEMNDRNQAILRALPDMMFLQNRAGDYLDFYARDPNLLAVSPDSFIGKNVRDLLPAELSERVIACLARLDDTDAIQVLDYSLEVGGEVRQFEARMVAAEGNKALSIVRDVTEGRRAVADLRSSEEKLQSSIQQIRKLAGQLMTAQESEQRRISLLLHDDVSQNIAALGLSLSRLKRKLPGSTHEIIAELEPLSDQANDLTTQIRRLSHQLHPEVLEHLGLVAALESHVAEFGHEEQIDLKFTSDVGSEHIPFDLSVCIYRVALEALHNVARHSGAKSAALSLKVDNGSLVLEVSDNGRGFDAEKARYGSGIGLLSAEERVKILQGSLEIQSDPQTGTVLRVSAPLIR